MTIKQRDTVSSGTRDTWWLRIWKVWATGYISKVCAYFISRQCRLWVRILCIQALAEYTWLNNQKRNRHCFEVGEIFHCEKWRPDKWICHQVFDQGLSKLPWFICSTKNAFFNSVIMLLYYQYYSSFIYLFCYFISLLFSHTHFNSLKWPLVCYHLACFLMLECVN